ncbi:MAG TPA: hypothetical protein PLX87_02990 [Bacteroidales bacterium]|nr:hypothetical protein [Bacteroidales bacterium]HOK73721.1 hypothetical protein [Bacteroidales bacterium]HPP91545.1 hypothetical protein [Bacteroidales bacterium]
MKKGLIITVLLLFAAFQFVFSQQDAPGDRLYAYKVAFLTKRLNLTPEEAQRFWPVYNELQVKKNELQKERTSIIRRAAQNELNMSEKELTEAADRLVSLELQDANLTAEYHKKFREILSPVKIIRLYQAENQYRLELLRELRNAPAAPAEQVPQRRLRNN